MLATVLMITVMTLSNPTGQVIENGMTRVEVEEAWGEPTNRIPNDSRYLRLIAKIAESWQYETEHGTVTVIFHRTGGEPAVGQIITTRKYLRELEALSAKE